MTADVINAIKALQAKIVKRYNVEVNKAKNGYPLLENSGYLLEAIYAIDYVKRYEIDQDEALTIIKFHYFNINGG